MGNTNRKTAYRKQHEARPLPITKSRVIVEMEPLWATDARVVYIKFSNINPLRVTMCFHAPGDRNEYGDCLCTACGAELWAPEWVGYAAEGYADLRESSYIHAAMRRVQ